MKPKLNLNEYQVMVDGKEKLVGDLTIAELQIALCHSIDSLEAVNAAADEVTRRIEAWRKGEDEWDAVADRVSARIAEKKSKA